MHGRRASFQEILKFGAKNLFQDTAGHGGHSGDDFENLEDEALAYVDIDDVLSRAETREDEPAACGAAEEFLSSFNVSNFDTFQKSVVRGRKKKVLHPALGSSIDFCRFLRHERFNTDGFVGLAQMAKHQK